MIDCVIKGTKTVAEFKAVQEDMLKRAERYSRKHIASCENWQELFSGLHIMIVKRKRMEKRKYLVARSPFVK